MKRKNELNLINKSFIIITLMSTIISFGQQNWEIVYGSTPSMGRQVILTKDACYMVASTNSQYDSGISLKINQQGNIMWVAPYGGMSIQQTYDDGYIMAGGYNYSEAILRKLDVNGNIEWSNTYGGGSQDEFHSVIQSSDSCIVACGYTHSFGDNTIYVVKTDSFGNLLWERSLNCLDYGVARDLIEVDNFYYVIGHHRDSDYNYFLFITKLNSDGITIWRKDYQIGFTGYSISMTNDSSLIVVGRNIITKLDLNGDILWCKNLDAYWDLFSVDTTPDNGFILSGNSLYEIENNWYDDNLLVKIDSMGNVQWHQTYPNDYDNSLDTFESVKSTISNGYIACGYSVYDNIQKLRVINTDFNGNIVGQSDLNIEGEIINIYPNPTFGIIRINGINVEHSKVYNLSGNEIMSVKKSNEIDISELSKGIYLIKIVTYKGTFTEKIIKQ